MKGETEREFYRSLPTLITVWHTGDIIHVKWPDGYEEQFLETSHAAKWFRRLFTRNKDYRA